MSHLHNMLSNGKLCLGLIGTFILEQLMVPCHETLVQSWFSFQQYGTGTKKYTLQSVDGQK